MELKLKGNSKPEKEALRKLLEMGQKNLIKVHNAVALRSPIEFEYVVKLVDLPRTTVFNTLKKLVELGTIVETIREKDTTTGVKKVSYYSTPYKIRMVLLERQETVTRFKVEAFDLALLGSFGIVLAFIKMYGVALGAFISMFPIIIYWIYFKIAKRGEKWKEV